MTEHLPECFAHLCECDDTHFKSTDCDFSCICPSLRACEQRVWKDPLLVVSRRAGWNDALIAARAALARTHRPVPVIECGGTCGWGKDCPECGIQSNRIVGYVCDACCNSLGDHAYCDDLHCEDTPLHHQDGQMWSGPHCPTLAAIDALKEKQ